MDQITKKLTTPNPIAMKGTWIKAHLAKSIGSCVVVSPAAVQTSEPSLGKALVFRVSSLGFRVWECEMVYQPFAVLELKA